MISSGPTTCFLNSSKEKYFVLNENDVIGVM